MDDFYRDEDLRMEREYIEAPRHYCYRLNAIDDGWNLCILAASRFIGAVAFAGSLAQKLLRWDGVFRSEDYCCAALPVLFWGCESQLGGILWKGEDNGDCYLVSTVGVSDLMPSLAEMTYCGTIVTHGGNQ